MKPEQGLVLTAVAKRGEALRYAAEALRGGDVSSFVPVHSYTVAAETTIPEGWVHLTVLKQWLFAERLSLFSCTG